MHLILGSKSPRRAEILSYFSLPFEQISPVFDERSVPFDGSPSDYVRDISKGKASNLALEYPEKTILTADTTVYCHGKIYNKPENESEAITMLEQLAGRWHSVYTGVTLQSGDRQYYQVEETKVLLNPLSQELIKLYHDQLHLYDKAGAYQIQCAGGLIVNRIDGCYYNVMGMPINSVRALLKEIGIELWNYLR